MSVYLRKKSNNIDDEGEYGCDSPACCGAVASAEEDFECCGYHKDGVGEAVTEHGAIRWQHSEDKQHQTEDVQ